MTVTCIRFAVCYPAIHSIGQDSKFTVALFVFYVPLRIFQLGFTDWHEFCMVLRTDLGQVFSHFAILDWITPGMAEFWGSTGAMWRDMLFAEALVTSL